MSELDFDELDKAVNTLMSDVPKVEPPKTDDIKTLNISSTLPNESRPSLADLNSALTEVNGSVSAPSEKPAPVSTPAPARSPSLATRRGGRFMDVVHPSSDMKGPTKPVLPASRQGVTIEPADKLLPEQSDDQSDVSNRQITPEYADQTQSASPKESVEVNSATSSPSEHDSPKNDWPDPLDMSGYAAESNTNTTTEAVEEVVVTAETHDVSSVEDDDALFTVDNLEDEDMQPLNSPFIADAKVEKRPLGGAPAEELDHAPVLGVLAEDATSVTDPADQLPATPHEVEPQLPPELQSDLMAIETDGSTSATDVATPEVNTAPVAVVVEEAPVPVIESKASVEPVVSTGPTSIPQQYHEEPSTSDEPNGSIYDTASYHQPLAHPAKTKSGWLWVIWILLLLIVGGGGAVALYFLDII
jgi:hypothetical protein